jgi:hypothetical protein
LVSLRFRISTLMAVVLLAASVFATSQFGGGLDGLIFVSTALVVLGVLSTTILGVIYRRGELRAFWVGFALFGWPVALGCLLLALNSAEALFFSPLAISFGWIGGVIARAFAVNSSEVKMASPSPSRDGAASQPLPADQKLLTASPTDATANHDPLPAERPA